MCSYPGCSARLYSAQLALPAAVQHVSATERLQDGRGDARLLAALFAAPLHPFLPACWHRLPGPPTDGSESALRFLLVVWLPVKHTDGAET